MSNLLQELSREFVSGDTTVVDPVTFIESAWGLGVVLTPVQKFVIKCFYSLPLSDGEKTIDVPDKVNEHMLYHFNEKEFLQWLYDEGRVNTNIVEGRRFQNLVMVFGRRSGKSVTAACIADYEFYKLLKKHSPAKFYNQAPGAEISIVNVAPTDQQSELVFKMAQSFAMRCPFLKDRFLHQTNTYFEMQTDEDIEISKIAEKKPKASLKFITGGCSSNGVRGNNSVLIVMDEMAFFLDNNGRFAGEQVYNAIEPSRLTFGRDGKMICMSSPYAKFGKLYDLYEESMSDPFRNEPEGLTLSFRMYSALVNPTRCPTEILKAKRRANRREFETEYGGEFSDAVTAWIEDENEFKRCITIPNPPTLGNAEIQYFYGIDLGFKNDGTAISIVHRDPVTEKIKLDFSAVYFSGSSDVWDDDQTIYKGCDKYRDLPLIRMSDIVEELRGLDRRFPIRIGVFDQHNGYALQELLGNADFGRFEMVNVSDSINSEIYQLVKRLYGEQLVELYDHAVLVPEMLTLEAENHAKNKVLVRAPIRPGAHDDISDSFCRAVWKCYTETRETGHNYIARGGVVTRHKNIGTPGLYALEKFKRHGTLPLRGGFRSSFVR